MNRSALGNALSEAVTATDALSQVTESARSNSLHLEKSVSSVNENTRTIEHAAESIRKLSKAIRIVAVNASIEAARAGEQGAAFATVAQEVDRMARECDKAVSEIDHVIEDTLLKTHEAAEATNSMSEEINHVDETQRRVVEQLNIIQYQIDSIAEGLQGEGGVVSEALVFDEKTMGTGVASIDDQHRKLIDMINALDRPCSEGKGREEIDKMLDFMGEYVVDHFSHEEGVMIKHRCSVSGKNKRAHENLLQKYTTWRKDYDASGASLAMVL